MKKTLELVRSTNGSKLHIKYKLINIKVCNKDICLMTTFVLVKGLSRTMLLRILFMGLIQLFTIDKTGIKTNIMEEEIIFQNFICKPIKWNLNILQEMEKKK